MHHPENDEKDPRGKLALGVILIVVQLFLSASVLSYSPQDGPTQFVYHNLKEIDNLVGLPGAWCAYVVSLCFGVAGYFIPLAFGVGVLLFWFMDEIPELHYKSLGAFLVLLSLSGFAAYFFNESYGPPIGPGGAVGALIKFLFDKIFIRTGAYVALVGIFTAGCVLIAPDAVVKRVIWSSGIGKLVGRVFRPFRVKFERTNPNARRRALAQAAPTPERRAVKAQPSVLVYRRAGQLAAPAQSRGALEQVAPAQTHTSARQTSPISASPIATTTQRTFERPARENAPLPPSTRLPAQSGVSTLAMSPDDVVFTPELVEDARRAVPDAFAQPPVPEQTSGYELPVIDLLKPAEEFDPSQFEDQIRERSIVLGEACEEFKVPLKVVGYQTGPVLTMYEVQLEKGTRVKQLQAIASDLAVKLAATTVRVVSPLPNKNTVGVELPNRVRINVTLREVMEACEEEAAKATLPVFVGRDVVGDPILADLAKMPHLLVAGSTGSGKSVFLNAIIMSLLMTRTPEQVKMVLIDPKQVELTPYKDIPHLMHPVVDDMDKAGAILEWACEQMEKRYSILSQVGARELKKFNAMTLEEKRRRLGSIDEDEWDAFPKTMPSIVIIVDELADLVMKVGKEVQDHIIRLAQKSRAVGIHLVLATQKPTRDVVTGLIKSNLPARISFRVTSQVDSRVVFDVNGAEKLLGNGDMLFLKPGTSDPIRGQGAFVSDEEIRAVLDQISVDKHDYEIVIESKKSDNVDPEVDVATFSYDPLYFDCVDAVIEEGKASASMLQRRFSIGYNRAARIVDCMTSEGLVSPPNPAKPSQPRTVLVTTDQWRGKQYAIESATHSLLDEKSSSETPARAVDDFEDDYESAPEVRESLSHEHDNLSAESETSDLEEVGVPNANSWTDESFERYLDVDADLDG